MARPLPKVNRGWYDVQRETKNENNYENVYTLQTLEEPSAHSIRALDEMMGERSLCYGALALTPHPPDVARCTCTCAHAQGGPGPSCALA